MLGNLLLKQFTTQMACNTNFSQKWRGNKKKNNYYQSSKQ